MCAHALKLARVRKVYFILANSKFGGLGSLMTADGVDFEQIDYRKEEIVKNLKDFYTLGNCRLEPSKRHRKPNKLKPEKSPKLPKIETTEKTNTNSKPEFELLGKRSTPPKKT